MKELDLINSRQQLEQRLSCDGKCKKIIDLLPSAVIITNEDIITSMNKAAIKLLKIKKGDDVVGKSVHYLANLCELDKSQLDFTACKNIKQKKNYNKLITLKVEKKQKNIYMSVKNLTASKEFQTMIILNDIDKYHQETIDDALYFDKLTNLPNRVYFNKMIQKRLSSMDPIKNKLALFTLDIDRFREINESIGYKNGDVLLKQLSLKLLKICDNSGILARTGGDRFEILLDKLESQRQAYYFSKDLQKTISEAFYINNVEIFITVSIGISMYPTDSDNLDTLIQNSEMALYKSKKKGAGITQFYTLQERQVIFKKIELLDELRKGISNDELVLNYQPKIDLSNGNLVGVEALLRWNSGKYGYIPPDNFIPIAEDTSLIIQIGEWVTRKVCDQINEWTSMGLSPIPIAINISARHLYHRDFAVDFLEIVKNKKVKPELIEIEITENSVINNLEYANRVLDILRKSNIKISLDDFGVGYSSLGYLRELNIDQIKIDRIFIKDLPMKKETEAITTAIVQMAHALNYKVIAEGIETKEQHEFLKTIDCDCGQGYLISRPLTSERIEEMLYTAYRLSI